MAQPQINTALPPVSAPLSRSSSRRPGDNTNPEPPPCCFHKLRELLRKNDPSIAVTTWYPQLWNRDSEKEFCPFFPVDNLRDLFEKESFDDILNCSCNKCHTECERVKYKYGFHVRNRIKQVRNNVLNKPDLCRIFGLLIECRVPRYITLFNDYLQRRNTLNSKFTREELRGIIFNPDNPASYVLTRENLDRFLKRQHCYFEEPIPWNSGATSPKRIDAGCPLPIMPDVTTCRPNREGGSESHVLKFNIFPGSLTKSNFDNNVATLLGDQVEVDLEKKYPFVIKIFKYSGVERDMRNLKIKLKEYEDIRASRRASEHTRDPRDFICMDISYFVYGSEYCLIYPKAIGTLEDFYNDPSDDWKNISMSSNLLWKQLAKVGEGIDFIHKSLHLQHLDLKPSNILIFGIQDPYDSGSEANAEGESSARISESSVGLSQPTEPVEAFSNVLFMISDLGHRIPKSDAQYEITSSSTVLETSVVLGDRAWGPPEWPDLRTRSTKEAYELYDYWNFGCILLESAVYDINKDRRNTREDGIQHVKDFRMRRKSDEEDRSAKFHSLWGNEVVLKHEVSVKLENLRKFRDLPTENPPEAKDLPARFYNDLAKEIRRLLRISPTDRRCTSSPSCIVSMSFSRPSSGTEVVSLPPETELPGSGSSRLPQTPQSPFTPGTPQSEVGSQFRSLNLQVEPPAARPNQIYYLLDPPAYYLSGAWSHTLDGARNNSRVWISNTVVRSEETRGIWEYTPATNQTHSYAVKSVSLPNNDLQGLWAITTTDWQEKHWKFEAEKDGLSFFENLSGIDYYAGPFDDVEVIHFAVSVPSGKLFKPDEKFKIERKSAKIWVLAARPSRSTTVRTLARPSSSGVSIHSNNTGMSVGSVNLFNNTVHQAWLFIVPDHGQGLVDGKVPGYGFIFNVTTSVSIEQDAKHIYIREGQRPGRQARILNLPPTLKVPFRIEEAGVLRDCYGDSSFLFPDEGKAAIFKKSFENIKGLLGRSNVSRRRTQR